MLVAGWFIASKEKNPNKKQISTPNKNKCILIPKNRHFILFYEK
jgi:hypothetical protein